MLRVMNVVFASWLLLAASDDDFAGCSSGEACTKTVDDLQMLQWKTRPSRSVPTHSEHPDAVSLLRHSEHPEPRQSDHPEPRHSEHADAVESGKDVENATEAVQSTETVEVWDPKKRKWTEADIDLKADEHEKALAEAHEAHGEEIENLHEAHGEEIENLHEEHDHKMSQVQRSTSLAMAWMLLGTVAFVTSLFYLVNSSDEKIKHVTWVSLSDTLSIFSSVLIFSALKNFNVDFFHDYTGNEHAPPSSWSVFLEFTCLSAVYVMLHVLLIRSRHNEHQLAFYGGLGAHVLGFASIDAYGSLIELPVFNASVLRATLFIFFVATTSVAVVSYIAERVRTSIVHYLQVRHALRGSGLDALNEQFADTEDEAIGLFLGLVNSMVIRFAVSGRMPPVHGNPMDKSRSEVALLTLAAVLSGLLLVLVINAMYHVVRKYPGPRMERLIGVLKNTLAMTMGWCFLFSAQWTFWTFTDDHGLGAGDKMTARMVMAAVLTIASYGSIFMIELLASSYEKLESLRPLARGFVLLLGLCWEAAFQQAVEGVGDCYTGHAKTFSFISLTTFLCIIVLPAWGVYILPRAKSLHKEGATTVFDSVFD